MEEREQLAWLARRVGWGVGPGQLDEWEAKGVDLVLDELTDPDGSGLPPRVDPFADLDRTPPDQGNPLRDIIVSWVGHVVEARRPLETWMQWFWHDFFAVSGGVVRWPGLLFDHFNLMAHHGLGNFRDLLHDMTVDGAMLVFLDGTHSTAEAPNENYGRELLELYSVGVGHFDEDDVLAAAKALTGWVVRPRLGYEVTFVPFRHDHAEQTLLGTGGVDDVDSVIEVVTDHPATHDRITRLIADKVLGPGVDAGLLGRHAAAFGETLELRPLVRGLLEDGLDGAGTEVLVEPFPWFVSSVRAVGTPPRDRQVGESLRAAGQIPFLPPNVGGFPPPSSYLTTSATVARFNLANAIADGASMPTPLVQAAEAGDVESMADALGVIDGFSGEAVDAISPLTDPRDRLAAALAAPDLIVA